MEAGLQDGGHRPLTTTEATAVLALDDLAEGKARGVVVEQDGERHDLILVRRADRVFAYVNACPHLGTPLETFPDRFLDRTGKRLICSTHGALFRIEDGLCLFGPCQDRSLAAVPIAVTEGLITLAGKIPSPPEPQR